MKTLKFALIAVILSFATMSFTTNDPGPYSTDQVKLSVQTTLRAAMQNHGLVIAMHAQIDKSFLQVDKHVPYTAVVRYNRVTFYISGSYDGWKSFFKASIGNNDPPQR